MMIYQRVTANRQTSSDMANLNEYSYLWDGTDPGWVVLRHNEIRIRISVRFSGSSPTLDEIKSLRSAIQSYRDRRPVDAMSELRNCPEVILGDYEPTEARDVIESCKAQGLSVLEEGFEAVHDLMINETHSMALVIENDATARMVIAEAVRRGLPLRLQPTESHKGVAGDGVKAHHGLW